MSSRTPVSPAYQGQGNKPVTIRPWVDPVGPTGRRQIVDAVLLRCDYDLDVTTAAFKAANQARLFKHITLSDAGGTRRDHSGEGARVQGFFDAGPGRFREPEDIGTGSDKTGRAELLLPLAKPFEIVPTGYSIPAEECADIKIQVPDDDYLSLGSSDVAINSLTYSALAICHEEDDVEFKARDVITEEVMETTTQHRLAVGGAYLASLLAFKTGDELADVSGWASHRITPIQPDEMEAEDMLAMYVASHQTVDYDEPLNDDKARVIYAPATLRAAKLTDLAYVGGSVTIHADNDVADVQFLRRTIERRHVPSANRTARMRSVDINALRVKTPRGKAPQSAFRKMAEFLPLTT